MEKTAVCFARWSWTAVIVLLAPTPTRAQTPPNPAATPPLCNRQGRLHRMFHHTAHTVQDKWIGYPENFVEPPLGHYLTEQLTIQVAKADSHRFTLYHTDFLPGTSLLSPNGASRYNIMAGKLAGWPGPITIEWAPEQPDLAETRRRAVMDILLQAGQPLLAERVIIGPSPYPGARGIEAMNNNANTILRSQMSAQGLALPPAESASMGVR